MNSLFSGHFPSAGTGKRVLVMGAFDTKGAEFAFLIDEIVSRGVAVLTLNFGVFDTAVSFRVDCGADRVAALGGESLRTLRAAGRRERVLDVTGRGARLAARELLETEGFDGVVGMGGGCGTSVITAAMRDLPLGIPKVCLSTLAGGDTSSFVGMRDIVLMPSLTDICLNRVSRVFISQAAGAICGMVGRKPGRERERPAVFASVFGNTNPCVDACAALLDERGYETIPFHATGTGGRLMEAMTREGIPGAVLDITTTELADWVCRGIMSAGEERLGAAGAMGIPHLIVPGCVDMANFGPAKSLPPEYVRAGRTFHSWNADVTLMRTNLEENVRMGRIFAAKANAARGPVAFLLPLRGLSMLDADGGPFCDREADEALFREIKENLRPDIPVIETNHHINDAGFAGRAVTMLLDLVEKGAPPNENT